MRIVLVLALLLIFAAIGNIVWGQGSNCGPREHVEFRLTTNYGEVPVWRGAILPQFIFELWTASAGTWTFTRTSRWGETCVLASGTDSTVSPAPKRGTEN